MLFKKIIFILASIFLIEGKINAQSFLNGSFETNTCPAGIDKINLTNVAYNGFMANSFSFGTWSGTGDMDILTQPTYGLAQQGLWYVALTGAGTDQISMTLNAPLVMGNPYTISFYDRGYSGFTPQPVEIGLSTVNNAYGTFMASTSVVPSIGVWTLRTISFVAPNNGQFITVRTAGAIGNWTQVDNFTFVSTLPIELLDFTSQCKDHSTQLNWSTATEKNNDFFSVERSQNGFDFIEIGEVKGSNNSDHRINYSFTDSKQPEGINYYRLKQNDRNGNSSYSNILVAEKCSAKQDLNYEVFPNPGSDFLNVRVSNFSTGTKLKILSSVGQTVYETAIENNLNYIDISGFDSGIYLIQIANDGEILTRKFTKK